MPSLRSCAVEPSHPQDHAVLGLSTPHAAPPARLVHPGNPLRISTRGENTAVRPPPPAHRRAQQGQEKSLSPAPLHLSLLQEASTTPNTPRAAQDCFWPLSVSLESTCCTAGCFCKKTYAKPRGFPHLASGLSASMANLGSHLKGDSRLDLSTLSHLELGYFIQHHTVRGKRKSKRKRKR